MTDDPLAKLKASMGDPDQNQPTHVENLARLLSNVLLDREPGKPDVIGPLYQRRDQWARFMRNKPEGYQPPGWLRSLAFDANIPHNP